MTSFLDDMAWRGLLHQVSDRDGLQKLMADEPVTGYIGFDPTADSLHIGSLQQICNLRRLKDHGHRAVALIGGGTGMIGDPSGKSEERNLLSAEVVSQWSSGIRAQLEELLGLDELTTVVDNATWLREAGLVEFLRDIGKHFSVNEMVRKDSVRLRLESREQGLSFTELSYMLLQSWDFVQLFDRYGCRLQLGGSDQWGNIAEGVGLVRRTRAAQAFGITSPLVTKADGSKFGKTETGTIWLDRRRTSPYHFFQFWLGTGDANVASYLRRFTFLPDDEVVELDRLVSDNPERREAQRVLAREITAMVHGPDETARAEAAAEALFDENVSDLEPATLESALSDAPTTTVERRRLSEGLSLVDALVLTGIASSKSAARRDILQGSISVNNRRQGEDRDLAGSDALHGRWVILRRGRRNQHVLQIVA